MILTGINVIFCVVVFLIFLQFLWCSFFSLWHCLQVFSCSKALTNTYKQTNSHERTLMHSTTVLVVVGWFFDSQITRDGNSDVSSGGSSETVVCSTDSIVSYLVFAFHARAYWNVNVLLYVFQCQLFPCTQPVFVFWSSGRARVNQPPVCLSLLSLSLTNTHYLTLVRVLSAIRNTLIKIIKKCTKLTTN